MEGSRKKVRQWKTKHPSSEYSNWIGAFYDCCQSCRAFEHLLLDVSGWEHTPERAFSVERYAAMSENEHAHRFSHHFVKDLRASDIEANISWRFIANRSLIFYAWLHLIPARSSSLSSRTMKQHSLSVWRGEKNKNPRSKLIARFPFFLSGHLCGLVFAREIFFISPYHDDLLIRVKEALWHDNKMKKSSWEPAGRASFGTLLIICSVWARGVS